MIAVSIVFWLSLSLSGRPTARGADVPGPDPGRVGFLGSGRAAAAVAALAVGPADQVGTAVAGLVGLSAHLHPRPAIA
jgi:hypothetical protein